MQSKTDFNDCTSVEGESACPHEEAEKQELADRARQLVSELPPQEAKVFCLRYLNDMSYREIADQLGMTTNSAGVLLHRARARLREHFELSARE